MARSPIRLVVNNCRPKLSSVGVALFYGNMGPVINVVYLASITLINFFAITIYSISSFGNGLIYHMGWQVCERISTDDVAQYCTGEIATANIHITVAAFLLLPVQLWLLFDYVDWKLGIHLSMAQQLGVFCGMWLVFYIHSDWVARFLGLTMLSTAIQKGFAELKLSRRTTDIEEDDAPVTTLYEFISWDSYVTVWCVGLTSGLFGGLYAAGGPPLMYFVTHINLEKNACRATVAFLYLIENMGRIVFIFFIQQDASANFHSPLFLYTVCALTGSSLLGLSIGNCVSGQINQKCFRYMILAVLTLGSILLGTTGFSIETSMWIIVTVSIIILCYYVSTYDVLVVRRSKVNGSDAYFDMRVSTTGSLGARKRNQFVNYSENGVELPSYLSPMSRNARLGSSAQNPLVPYAPLPRNSDGGDAGGTEPVQDFTDISVDNIDNSDHSFAFTKSNIDIGLVSALA